MALIGLFWDKFKILFQTVRVACRHPSWLINRRLIEEGYYNIVILLQGVFVFMKIVTFLKYDAGFQTSGKCYDITQDFYIKFNNPSVSGMLEMPLTGIKIFVFGLKKKV